MSVSASILVADDDEASARSLNRLLTKEGHRVSVVESARRTADPSITRRAAPSSSTSADLSRLIPVVIVTAQSDRRERLRGIDAGCDDFLTKPFDPMELHARIQSLVRLKRYTDELESAEAIILGLGATIEARDPYTRGHCQRLAHYATTLGRSLGLSDSDLGALERGGFLHDIGKIAVPDRVLLKDGKLDPQESSVMRKHPLVGDSLCAGLRSLQSVRPIVRHHHERLDGSGYPDGLRNSEVPLLAQIVGIADVFDALTTERPYRCARPAEEAFEALRNEAAKGWRSRELVDAFVGIVNASR